MIMSQGTPIPCSPEWQLAERHPVNRRSWPKIHCELFCAQVAAHLLGCSQPLQAVVQHVVSIYSDSLNETSVRDMVIDLAARKPFAATDSEHNHTPKICTWTLWLLHPLINRSS